MLGDEWLNLPEDEEKEQYIQEMKDYNIIHPPQPKKPKSSGSGSVAIANPKE